GGSSTSWLHVCPSAVSTLTLPPLYPVHSGSISIRLTDRTACTASPLRRGGSRSAIPHRPCTSAVATQRGKLNCADSRLVMAQRFSDADIDTAFSGACPTTRRGEPFKRDESATAAAIAEWIMNTVGKTLMETS